MWDGEDYETESDTRENVANYGKNGFETKLIEEDGKFLVYTRRVATDATVDGEPV